MSRRPFGKHRDPLGMVAAEARAAERNSALRAESAGPQPITRLDVLSLVRKHTHRCYVAGVNCAEVDPKYMAEIESALNSLAKVDWEANARCLLDEVMQLRVVIAAAAAGTATSAAAPGDLPIINRSEFNERFDRALDAAPSDTSPVGATQEKE